MPDFTLEKSHYPRYRRRRSRLDRALGDLGSRGRTAILTSNRVVRAQPGTQGAERRQIGPVKALDTPCEVSRFVACRRPRVNFQLAVTLAALGEHDIRETVKVAHLRRLVVGIAMPSTGSPSS